MKINECQNCGYENAKCRVICKRCEESLKSIYPGHPAIANNNPIGIQNIGIDINPGPDLPGGPGPGGLGGPPPAAGAAAVVDEEIEDRKKRLKKLKEKRKRRKRRR